MKTYAFALIVLQMLDCLSQNLQVKISLIRRIHDYAVKLHVRYIIRFAFQVFSNFMKTKSKYPKRFIHFLISIDPKFCIFVQRHQLADEIKIADVID